MLKAALYCRTTVTTKAMRELNLQEYQRSEPLPLSVSERDTLRGVLCSVAIEPVAGTDAEYYLTPGATVGAVEVGDLSVFIHPKIDIPKLLSLA